MRTAMILFAVLLSACANTRDPNPVTMKQSGDTDMTCRQLETEYRANTDAATYKISKNNSDDGQDVLLGLFIWPGLADFKNADGIEGNAMLDRNIFLRQVAAADSCDMADWPAQPSRND